MTRKLETFWIFIGRLISKFIYTVKNLMMKTKSLQLYKPSKDVDMEGKRKFQRETLKVIAVHKSVLQKEVIGCFVTK